MFIQNQIDKPEAKSQSKVQSQVTVLSLKSHGPPPTHPNITFKRSGWEYMVQMEALSTAEWQEGVPSQGEQQREEHREVHHVQVKHYGGRFKCVSVIVIGPVGNPESYPLHNSKS